MKTLNKIWLFLSFIIIAFIIINLINAYISFKYEIEEPKSMGLISDILLEKEKHLRQLIFWFWLFLIIIIVNVLILFKGTYISNSKVK